MMPGGMWVKPVGGATCLALLWEFARDSGESACTFVGYAAVIASKLAPTMGSEYDRKSQVDY
ncbi:hypothetical protein EMIT043CA1_30197 [Pseudomonas brassicacearum]